MESLIDTCYRQEFFLSLAFTDLAVGLFVQLIYDAIIAVMLQMTATGNNNFDILCPTIIIACYFFILLLVGASFQNIAAIAIDRLLALSLHLRYFVTSKRIVITLVILWLTSGVTASIFIHLPSNNNMLAATIELVGLLLSAVAYIRICRVIRYHQNQIHSQLHLPNVRVMVHLREKKSALNALFVYIVFVACLSSTFVLCVFADKWKLSNFVFACWRRLTIFDIPELFIKPCSILLAIS